MEINILIDEGLEDSPSMGWLHSMAEQILVAQGTADNVEMSLVITSEERVRQLNQSYRGRDEPTDVLAFSAIEEVGKDLPPFIVPPDGVLHLGEVIISHPQAAMQAEEHQHSLKREISILIIHGVLHLLGHEHDKPDLERQMRAREDEILSSVEERL